MTAKGIMSRIAAAVVIWGLAVCPALAEWINPLKLEKGKTYILSQSIPLSPKKEIPGSLDELRQLNKAPRRGKIKIVKAVPAEDKTLYFVEARTRNNRSVGRGWISSVQLAGQSLKRVAAKKRGRNKDAIRILDGLWSGQ